MLSWFSSRNENIRTAFPTVEGRYRLSESLKKMYNERLLPLEEFYHFHDFHSFRIEDSEFDSKPMVLLVGQYSTGKTTFIKSVIEQDYPGMRIGPEPTTDNFVIVTDGPVETIIPGNALVSDKAQPFCPLARFGNSFLNRLQMSTVSNPVLENITFVDTPGVASGAKHQKMHRGYDFAEVIAWFANHADRIILFFDACKLDISDELKKVIEIVRGNDDKLRVVFNKADMLSDQELMRGYGALMWFLGRALPAPEPSRLFIVSFWMSELINDDNRKLLELEAQDLYQDLQTLPRSAAIRKVNDLIKRARLAKVHAYIINELFQLMPTSSAIFGRRFSGILSVTHNRRSRESLLDKLPDIYDKLQRRKDLSLGDFPSIRALRERLMSFDYEIKLQPLKQKLIDDVDAMLSGDASPLMSALISGRSNIFAAGDLAKTNEIGNQLVQMDYQVTEVVNGIGDTHVAKDAKGHTLVAGVSLAPIGVVRDTPFAPGRYEGLDAGSDCFLQAGKSNLSSRDGTLDNQKASSIVKGTPFETNYYDENCCWGIDSSKRSCYTQIFAKLAGEDGKANGETVREELLKSKLPTPVLAKIWRLSDMDRDNCLDEDEFTLAMYLVEMKQQGFELPQVPALTTINGNSSGKMRSPLPIHLIPPSKRHLVYF